MDTTRLLFMSLVLNGMGLLGVPTAGAQDRGLSGEFSQLSAKERSRLAREESEAALKDTAFQATMARAEAHFQARRYEVAMADYERARALRPLNVYPPVKIDDLRVLIAKRDAAVAQARADSAARSVPVPAPEPPVVREEEVPDPAPSAPEQPLAKAPGSAPVQVVEAALPEPAPPRPRATTQTRPAPTPAVRPDAKGPEPPVPAVREPGIHEEQFKEGNAIVLQRTVTTATEVHIYRKVTHSWGRTFHFLDGLPVDERAWTERFGDR